MLVRLMYASRAVPAVDAEELQSLLRQCRTHNPQHGVTGVLCFADRIFLQVLEGSRSAVNRLYQRIVGDTRHTDVELLSYNEIDERRFAGWAMGQVQMAGLNPALLLKYSASATLDPYAIPGRVSMALFDDLVATASIHCERG
jgi:Sensors of blue-light using FAD